LAYQTKRRAFTGHRRAIERKYAPIIPPIVQAPKYVPEKSSIFFFGLNWSSFVDAMALSGRNDCRVLRNGTCSKD
jgi:hypothetical protein